MKKIIALTFLLVTNSLFAQGNNGIQYFSYNKNRVPNIVGAAGIATEIIFEKDEKIDYHSFGFQKGWDSQVVSGGNILVFIPQDDKAQTNLIVHTNKRNYVFTVTIGKNNWEKHPKNSGADYSIRMVYRDGKSIKNLQRIAKQKAKEKAAREKRKKTEQGLLRNADIATLAADVYTDYDYRSTLNATDITPQRVWDNGKFTFIAFSKGMKRGVAYELNKANKASLVNQHTERNGLLIVHGVYPKLIIRLGEQAVELRRNDISNKAKKIK